CNQLNNGNTQPPSGPMLDGLVNLLAWKSTGYEIDPQTTHMFCKGDGSNCLSLWTISGHRDAYPTSCPGDLTYNDLQLIRSQTAAKKLQQTSYSAKQLSYSTVNLGDNSEKSVTLSFKNTGAATWSNSTLPVVLATANPDNKGTPFQGSGWPAPNIAATL